MRLFILFIILFWYPFSWKLEAQVVTPSYKDIIITEDVAICAGGTVALKSVSLTNYKWSPVEGLSDPNFSSPTAKPSKNTTYHLLSETRGKNEVVNGDFELGNSGFSSEYLFSDNGFNASVFYVSENIQAWHSAMPGCKDHTSSGGKMLLVNGANITGVKVWSQIITVIPYTNYEFSCWLQHITTINPASLQFSINGVPLNDIFRANSTSCIWERFFAKWNSGNITTCEISIINMNTDYSGNDFALDDIFFQPVEVFTDSVRIKVEEINIKASADTSVCAGTTLQLNALGAHSYSWSPMTLENSNTSTPVVKINNTPVTYIVTGTNLIGCKSSDTVNISVLPSSGISITEDTSICPKSNVQLNASGGVSYKWSPIIGLNNQLIYNPVASPLVTTKYFVDVINEYGCSGMDSIIVNVLPNMNVGVSNDTAICSKSSIQLFATGGMKYLWAPSININNLSISNPYVNPVASTIYSVKITSAENCSEIRDILVSILPAPQVQVSNDTIVCGITPVQLNASGGKSFQWSPAVYLTDPNISNPIASPIASTMYKVFVKGANSCTSLDSVKITIKSPPIFGIINSNPSGCAGSTIQLNAYGGDKYQWIPSTGLSDPLIADPIARISSDQVYNVTISETICNVSETFSIPVKIDSIGSLIVSKSNDINCNFPYSQLSTNISGIQYLWTPTAGLSDPTIANPVASPANSTIYSVLVTGVNGCKATGNIEVKAVYNNDFRLYQMPNSFTPNGDGKNDCFGLSKWGNINILEFLVFNRWGQVVFAGNNSKPCWNGSFKGIDQEGGNYVFKVTAQTGCGIVERIGNVVLIR